jgi:hypothetical protein
MGKKEWCASSKVASSILLGTGLAIVKEFPLNGECWFDADYMPGLIHWQAFSLERSLGEKGRHMLLGPLMAFSLQTLALADAGGGGAGQRAVGSDWMQSMLLNRPICTAMAIPQINITRPT